MNCIVIDDEPLARKGLAQMIEELSDIKIIGSFHNAVDALIFLKTNEVDLILSDIEMPGLSGLDFASQISRKTMIIFITAYSQYALESYEYDALDYVVKPIERSRLDRALRKALSYHSLLDDNLPTSTIEKSNNDSLLIKADRRFYKINMADIHYIEGLKDYVVIHIGAKRLITSMNLKAISLKLNKDIFLRVSKSYIVNLKKVDSFDSHNLYIGESEIPIGEMYKNEFQQRYLEGFSDL